MNLYVIVRDDGWFVAATGMANGGSYTKNLTEARTFSSPEAAGADGVCQNERVVNVANFLRPYRD